MRNKAKAKKMGHIYAILAKGVFNIFWQLGDKDVTIGVGEKNITGYKVTESSTKDSGKSDASLCVTVLGGNDIVLDVSDFDMDEVYEVVELIDKRVLQAVGREKNFTGSY